MHAFTNSLLHACLEALESPSRYHKELAVLYFCCKSTAIPRKEGALLPVSSRHVSRTSFSGDCKEGLQAPWNFSVIHVLEKSVHDDILSPE